MIRFECDYGEGAHPSILQRLQETNLEQTPGYGEDVYCAKARETIKKLCGTPKADVQFLVGGTQANLTVVSAALRPHQGVVAAQSAHINVHETGSIEACGHKVLALPAKDGKIAAGQIAALCEAHRADASREHTVQPKMVYLSQPTELGTLYTRSELMAISDVCRANGLYLFVDGARLGYGIAAAGNDVSFGDLGTLCDVFYIGGTKQGALFGEAVVLVNPALQEDFRYLIKQKGGMLAKGRLLGLQFSALLEEQAKLYLSLSRHADRLADRLRAAFSAHGFSFLVESRTNQVFPILPDALLDALAKDYSFSDQQRIDPARRAVRFCTSWATKEADVDALCADLDRLCGVPESV